jgi:predicted RNase H-like nuclease (RuvC/YqgF family)
LAWETEKDDLISKIKNSSREINSQSHEIRRLNLLIEEKSKEIDCLRSKLHDSQSYEDLEALQVKY